MSDMQDTDADVGQDAPSEEIVKEALGMGWTPRERYKGPPDKWIDAAEFVERGHRILPIVNARAKKLEGELGLTKQQLAEMRESMEQFKVFHDEMRQSLVKQKDDAYAQAVSDLKAAKAQARRDGDDSRVDEIDEALLDLKIEKAAKPVEKPADKVADRTPQDLSKTPEFKAWALENKDWFGVDEDMSAYAVAQAQIIRQKNPNIGVEEFLTQVSEKVNKFFGDRKVDKEEDDEPRPRANKVAGAGRGAGGGRSYADLPSDARAVCDEDASRFVGPNKMYKTAKEWQSAYAKMYFDMN